MSHTRTAIAILSLATITVPAFNAGADATNPGSPEITVATTSTTVLESPTVIESPAVAEQPQEISEPLPSPLPDFPITTEVEGNPVYAETEEQVARVQRALDTFTNAGLELPTVEIRMHEPGSADCVANDGRLLAGVLSGGTGAWTIFMCGTDFTLLHELGHLWDNHAMTDDKRAEFLGLRKADAWSGVEWSRAGGEHLADVLAWGLSGGEVRPSRTLPNDDASLAEAFETATGFAPQHLEV